MIEDHKKISMLALLAKSAATLALTNMDKMNAMDRIEYQKLAQLIYIFTNDLFLENITEYKIAKSQCETIVNAVSVFSASKMLRTN